MTFLIFLHFGIFSDFSKMKLYYGQKKKRSKTFMVWPLIPVRFCINLTAPKCRQPTGNGQKTQDAPQVPLLGSEHLPCKEPGARRPGQTTRRPPSEAQAGPEPLASLGSLSGVRVKPEHGSPGLTAQGHSHTQAPPGSTEEMGVQGG